MRRSIYLDTNIFIKAMEASDAEAELAWTILQAIAGAELNGLTSELTLAEVLPKPMADGDQQLVEAYEGALHTGFGLIVAPVTRSVLKIAAGVRADTRKMRLPDAIHIATALEHGCTAVISNDLRMRGGHGIRTISLTSTSLDELKTLTS